jgi:hypothetical protein
MGLWILGSTRFRDANRFPLRSKALHVVVASRWFIHATSRWLDALTGHIGRLYLHIEAIFVFDPGLDHWSARAGGEPFRVASAG